MKVVVGLGNPGPEYMGTRHNLGFEVVERVAKRVRVPLHPGRGPSNLARTKRGGEEVLLCCPQTFMNLSGEALARLDPRRLWTPGKVLVVYDDLDLPPGALRVRKKGSAAGHRGVLSVEESLATSGFPRVRLGIGAPGVDSDAAEYVLQRPTPGEWEEIQKAVAGAVQAVITWLDSTPLDVVMSRFNRMPELPERPQEPKDGPEEPGE